MKIAAAKTLLALLVLVLIPPAYAMKKQESREMTCSLSNSSKRAAWRAIQEGLDFEGFLKQKYVTEIGDQELKSKTEGKNIIRQIHALSYEFVKKAYGVFTEKQKILFADKLSPNEAKRYIDGEVLKTIEDQNIRCLTDVY